jgi:hypothetical protein
MMRLQATAFMVAALFRPVAIAMAQASEQAPVSTSHALDSKSRTLERTRDERVYLEGRTVDAMLLPDGSIAYLLEWPPAETLHDSDGPWVLVAHPVRGGISSPLDPVTGKHVVVGFAPDGTYYGFAWFIETVPDVLTPDGRSRSVPLYEADPPDIEERHAEEAAPSHPVRNAAVLRWWAAWEEWSEKVRAGDLVPHDGLVSDCRETEGATVVTVKGDGTFQFLYRDHDRVTYEGVPASSPCDVVGQRVVVWTLPCGDDGPCIRKIEAIDGVPVTPRASSVEAVAEDPVPHSGLIADCRESDGTTVVTLKGNGTFQFLYRSRDRVVYEGVQASNPCDLIGTKVVVWTVACDEDGPCIRKVAAVTEP